jgi:glycosyltransferase involved in cell wall biosynthesis
MHALHIVGWYPNAIKPFEAPFIQRHIAALAPHMRNTVWQLDVRQGSSWSMARNGPRADRTMIITTPLRRWLIIEWLATLNILWAWSTRDRSQKYDLVNFHIAYPNCTRIAWLQRVIGLPVIMTEHWSIYRMGFRSGSRGIDRIRRIFHAGVPLIVVSHALEQDITSFAGPPAPRVHIVPNAIDTAVFQPREQEPPRPGCFFAIATWKYPKRPLVMLEAIRILRDQGRSVKLRIAGGGPELDTIAGAVKRLGLENEVELLGQASPELAAREMRQAHALIHVSDHETYSAVCAEALCCGTPVFASNVGGIPEYLEKDMGVLVDANDAARWATVIAEQWEATLQMDRAAIAARMQANCSMQIVGERYAALLKALVRSGATGNRKEKAAS